MTSGILQGLEDLKRSLAGKGPTSSGPLPPREELSWLGPSCGSPCQGCPQQDISLPSEDAEPKVLLELQALVKQQLEKGEERAANHEQQIFVAREAMVHEQEELQRRQHRCKELEMEIALQKRDLQHSKEWQSWQQERHSADLRHQAEVLELKYEASALAEQEAWQQMDVLFQTAQRRQVEHLKEREMQDLAASFEAERFLATELRTQTRQDSAKLKQLRELTARLAGRELEILALEGAVEAQRAAEERRARTAEELRSSERQQREAQEASQQEAAACQRVEEASREALQAEAAQAEVRAAEAARFRQALCAEEASYHAECRHLAECAEALRRSEEREATKATTMAAEATEHRAREEALEQRIQDLQRLVDTRAEKPEPEKPPEPRSDSSDYFASAEDELDRLLEKDRGKRATFHTVMFLTLDRAILTGFMTP